MSRAYRVSVSQSTRKHVRVEDGVQTRLELLHILSPEEMAELLAAELDGLEFERDGDVMRRIDEDGLEIDIDLQSGTVTARLAAEADLDLRVDLTRVADRNRAEEARAALRKEAGAALEKKLEKGKKNLTAEITRKLEQGLRDLRAELDRAANRATAEALKTRARQLGEVEEISEDPETGELTIRVRV